MTLSYAMKIANQSQALADSTCAQIVNLAFSSYKFTLSDLEAEHDFFNGIRCFIQGGDGLVFTDIDGNTVPVKTIKDQISKKGYFDHQDFMDSRI